MSISEFQIHEKLGTPLYFNFAFLGEGAYSTVYKVKRISDQKTYALKKVKMD